MKSFRTAIAIALLVICTGVASAKVYWPAGWTTRTQNDSIVSQSPPAADGSIVVMIAAPVERATAQSFAAWFEMKVRAAATGGATIGRRFGTNVEDGTLYKDGFELRQSGQLAAYVLAFGYDTRQGRQFLLILRSAQVDKHDPRVLTAEDTLADAWRAKLPLGKAAEAPVQASRERTTAQPSAGTPPSNSGCHEEMTNITTWTMQQFCYPSAGGMSNCHLESVPVQQRVLQTVCR